MSETFVSSVPQKVENKKRGTLLTVWLVLMLIINIGSVLTYQFWSSYLISRSSIPSWLLYSYEVLSLTNVVFVIFLLKWKKWAFFAFSVSMAVSIVLNLSAGTGAGKGMASAIGNLISVIILYLILRPSWGMFE